MKREKEDRRVMYTKMFLRDSLLELMKNKPISKITPTELCRHADINRNTFYSHFNSTEDLLHSIENELYEQVSQSIERSLKNGQIPAFLTEICQVIYRNGDLCKTIFSDYGDKDFLWRIVDLAHDRSIVEWKAMGVKLDDEQLELLYVFSTNGSVAVIQEWMQRGMKYSPEEIACFIEKTNSSLLKALI